MKTIQHRGYFIILVIAMVLFFSVTGYASERVLQYGMTGKDVKVLQQELQGLGYYQGSIDRIFGVQTKNAVMAFQRSKGLRVDGIVGVQTYQALRNITQRHNISSRSSLRRSAELVSWQDVNQLIPVGTDFLVTDVDTQRSYNARRLGGLRHVDVEPVTTRDTAIMKEVYGGQWRWNRRAIIITVNGRRIAASQNGMPHGVYNIGLNNFKGHFCIHVYHSKKHYDNQEDPQHQAMVRKAAGLK